MLDFIRQYWKIIALSILLILDILILVIKKRPIKIVDAVSSFISDLLPELILDAERAYPNEKTGDNKLKYVLELVYSMLVAKYGLTYEEARSYTNFIKLRVEAILSTPQKKGE